MKTSPSAPDKPGSGRLVAGVLLLGLIVFAGLALWQLTPPAVVPSSAPAVEFSGERAMADLAVIAQAPRPTGSQEIRRVESVIVEQLSQMGLRPEIQATTAVQVKDEFESVWAGEVRNILARIPGSASSRPIFLSAHYDSSLTGPGASDCGSCVVTLLETARALQGGPPLKNDVILVFNNAEEHEMLGANSFVAGHPWAQQAMGLTLNFEAQGSRGPAYLYVTSPNNGWLIRETVRAAPDFLSYSFLNGLIGALVERAGSDLEEFMAVGSPGLGLVYTWNTPAYHSRLDSVQNVDPRSIQQEGSFALAVVRHFGDLDLAQPQSGDATFFTILPGVTLGYPVGWALPVAGLAALVFIVVQGLGLRRKQLTIGGLLLGFVAAVVSLLAALVVVSLAWWAVKALNPNFQVFMVGAYRSDLYMLGLVLLTVATAAGVFALFRARLEARDLAAGNLLLIGVLTALTSLGMPAGSYLFSWSLLAGSLGLAWWLLRDQAAQSWEKAAVLILAAAPACLMFIPIGYMLVPIANRAEAFLPLPLMGIPMAFFALLMTLLVLQLEALSAWGRWALPAGALGLSVAALLAAVLLSGFNQAQPRPDMIVYQLDAGTGQAAWFSVDKDLDAYNSRFFANGSEKSSFVPFPSESPQVVFPAWKAAAPDAALPAPNVELKDVSTKGDEVTYRLHVQSLRQALNLELRVQSEGKLVSGAVNGQEFDFQAFPTDRRNLLRLQYYGVPVEGFDLVFTTRSQAPVSVTVEDRSWGLPLLAGYDITRPEAFMAAPYELSDATLVQKTYQFP